MWWLNTKIYIFTKLLWFMEGMDHVSLWTVMLVTLSTWLVIFGTNFGIEAFGFEPLPTIGKMIYFLWVNIGFMSLAIYFHMPKRKDNTNGIDPV